MINIGQTAEVDDLLQMPPGTHKEQLTLDKVLFLLGSIGQFVHILQTEVHLTDHIPSVFQ